MKCTNSGVGTPDSSLLLDTNVAGEILVYNCFNYYQILIKAAATRRTLGILFTILYLMLLCLPFVENCLCILLDYFKTILTLKALNYFCITMETKGVFSI